MHRHYWVALVCLGCSTPAPEPLSAPAEAPTAPLLGRLLEQLAPLQGARAAPWSQAEIGTMVQWDAPSNTGDSVLRHGRFKGAVPNEGPLDWDLRLTGNAQGYSTISLAHANSQEVMTMQASDLVGTATAVVRAVQRCDEDPTNGFAKSEVTFATKAPGWLRVEWSAGSAGTARWLTYSFDPRVGKTKEACPTK